MNSPESETATDRVDVEGVEVAGVEVAGGALVATIRDTSAQIFGPASRKSAPCRAPGPGISRITSRTSISHRCIGMNSSRASSKSQDDDDDDVLVAVEAEEGVLLLLLLAEVRVFHVLKLNEDDVEERLGELGGVDSDRSEAPGPPKRCKLLRRLPDFVVPSRYPARGILL